MQTMLYATTWRNQVFFEIKMSDVLGTFYIREYRLTFCIGFIGVSPKETELPMLRLKLYIITALLEPTMKTRSHPVPTAMKPKKHHLEQMCTESRRPRIHSYQQ
jgi:hypothetical protein